MFSSEVEMLESGFERAADSARLRLEREAKFALGGAELEVLESAFRGWALARENAVDSDARNAWNTSLVGSASRILKDSRVTREELRELTASLERSLAAGRPEIPASKDQ